MKACRPGVSVFVALIFFSFVSFSITMRAQTYTPLYNYPETNRGNTGVFSQVLAQGRDGNFYSTIANGGTNSGGSAYLMTTAGQLTTLYNFCPLTGCADGEIPYGGLTLGFDGNFYSTAQGGGSKAAGTVFKMTPSGTESVLYNFTNGTDDSAPIFTLLQGQDGSLYGVSEEQYNGQYGTFFKINAAGVFSVLHDFAYSDGANPELPAQGTDGNFYGTARLGGDPTCKCGVIYKITPAGATTVLHAFTGYPNDGNQPLGILVQANDGFLYGTTYEGGAYNQGTVFKISVTGVYTLLHSFHYASPVFDGQLPYAGLTMGSDGNLYGTTTNGGANSNAGVIFQITPTGTETILYNFCAVKGCTDGFYPEGPLAQNTNGVFYGTTTGNSLGGGVFYSLNTGLKPFVSLLNWEGKIGKTVEILGQGFTGTTKVSFNGTSASFTVSSGTYLTAVVPAGATTGFVTVTTPSGTLKSNRKFLVTPTITSFSPTSGPVGTVVTINGGSLTQAQGVGFGNRNPAQFTVDSDIEVTATVPAKAQTGPIGILTPGGTAISSQTFTVTQ